METGDLEVFFSFKIDLLFIIIKVYCQWKLYNLKNFSR